MRKVVLILATMVAIVLAVVLYPSYVDKPVKDGRGPMGVYIAPGYAAPEYHSPLEWWQTHHMDVVNAGTLEQSDCLYCHEPERSCNNCHDYVGVAAIQAAND